MTQPATFWNGALPTANIVPDVATAEGIGIPQPVAGLLLYVHANDSFYKLSLNDSHAVDNDIYLSTILGGLTRWIKLNVTSANAIPRLPIFSNATRPSPAVAGPGSEIFNSDDNAPNFSDGTNWRDADGNIT